MIVYGSKTMEFHLLAVDPPTVVDELSTMEFSILFLVCLAKCQHIVSHLHLDSETSSSFSTSLFSLMYQCHITRSSISIEE